MIYVAALVMLCALFVVERLVAWYRRRRIDHDRSRAEYPITSNDPTNRTII